MDCGGGLSSARFASSALSSPRYRLALPHKMSCKKRLVFFKNCQFFCVQNPPSPAGPGRSLRSPWTIRCSVSSLPTRAWPSSSPWRRRWRPGGPRSTWRRGRGGRRPRRRPPTGRGTGVLERRRQTCCCRCCSCGVSPPRPPFGALTQRPEIFYRTFHFIIFFCCYVWSIVSIPVFSCWQLLVKIVVAGPAAAVDT